MKIETRVIMEKYKDNLFSAAFNVCKNAADTLNEVVTYGKDDSYREYSGQAVIYTITMNDGTEITVNAYNPFIVIDGIWYKTKYEPCERLSQIANELAK